jgi:glutamate-1-semialdehyde 2,1-aminomutase
MAQAKARLANGAERPRIRPIRPAAPDYAAILRDACSREGAIVCDADGRELVDLVNDKGAVLLGWNDKEIEAKVRAGKSPELLEIEASQRLTALIPSAEAVGLRASFEGALAEALLAAKTLTGRDGAFFCDEAVSKAGDSGALAQALERFAEEVAAVVIRPLDAPRAFLAEARRLTRRFGALLIFDERKSAFRVHRGGAQNLAGVYPDLTLIGASVANGRPMAVIAGVREVMRAAPGCGARIPAACLAAACVTLERVDRVDAAQALRVTGAEIAAEVEARLNDSGAAGWLEVAGEPAWSVVKARPRPGADAGALESALSRALFDQGVLSLSAHVPSLAFGEAEMRRLLDAYNAVLPPLALSAVSGGFERRPTRRAS